MHRHVIWLSLVLVWAGCSDEPTPPDASDVAADTEVADGVGDGSDVAPTDVEDTSSDVPGGIPCTLDDECAGQLSPAPCEVEACINLVCVIQAGPLCCNTADDCDPAAFPESNACLVVVCTDQLCQLEPGPEGCCLEDDECAGLASNCCEAATCVDNECQVDVLEECCELSAECDDGDSSTTDVCLNTCEEGGCLHHAPLCPDAKEYFKATFDTSKLDGMVVEDSSPGDGISWQLTTAVSSSPYLSLHMGHPLCGLYYNGPVEDCAPVGSPDQAFPTNLSLESPDITLDPGDDAFLGFWVRMSAKEAGPGPGDKLRVLILSDAGADTVWTSTEAFGDENTTGGAWTYQVVDLSEVDGAFKVHFEFNSLASDNYFAQDGSVLEGVYLDDITIQSTCDAAACDSAGQACPLDANGCTSDACAAYSNSAGGVCTYAALPQQKAWTLCAPCGQADDCGTNACYEYACVDQVCDVHLKDSCCANYTCFPEGTVPPNTTSEGFEGGLSNVWTLADPNNDNVSWQVVADNPQEGLLSLYFGDPDTGTYEAFDGLGNPQPAVATIWTKTFTVNKEQYRTALLMFWLHMSTEYDGTPGPDPGENYDTLTLSVQKAESGEVIEIWSSVTDLGNTTNGEYQQVGVNLSPFEKQDIRFGFTFDSGGSNKNGYGGVYIDDLALNMICGKSPCVGSSECDDLNECTFDYCEGGSCVNEQLPDCCQITADCDDDNDCTADICVAKKCEHTYDPTQDDCCSEGPWAGVPLTTFDTDLDGFTIETDQPPVTWYIDDEEFYEGGGSAHFANPSTGTYNVTLKVASGRLITPTVLVPPYKKGVSYVEFRLYMDTEWTVAEEGFVNLFKYLDELTVRVKLGDTVMPEPVWTSHFTQNSTFGSWILTRADLSDYAGQEVQLVFEFNAGDSSNNNYPGAYLDNLTYGTACLEPDDIECVDGGDCSSGASCELPVCTESFECLKILKNTPDCCEPTVAPEMAFSFDLKKYKKGWSFKSCELGFGEPDPSVEWQIAKNDDGGEIKPKEGTGFLYFGNGTDFGGSNNMGSCGTATSPEITLTDGVPWTMMFFSYLDAEQASGCEDSGASWADKFEIKVIEVESGKENKIWSKSDMECDEYAAWFPRTLDLSEFAGETIQLRFEFNSWDQAKNDGHGAGIDTLELEKGCAEN